MKHKLIFLLCISAYNLYGGTINLDQVVNQISVVILPSSFFIKYKVCPELKSYLQNLKLDSITTQADLDKYIRKSIDNAVADSQKFPKFNKFIKFYKLKLDGTSRKEQQFRVAIGTVVQDFETQKSSGFCNEIFCEI